MFVARYRPWTLGAIHWGRTLTLLGAFLGGGALWGSVCGLAFGLVLWRAGRSRRFQQLSAPQLMLWGALGGAAFPVLLYTPVVLLRGAYGSIPFFGMLACISALVGAACGGAVFALAKRAPTSIGDQAMFGAPPLGRDVAMPIETRDRVR